MDIFGIPVPHYIDGDKIVRSTVGAILSILVMFLLIIYAANQMQILIYHMHPVITTSVLFDWDGNNGLDFQKDGVKFAVGIIDKYTDQPWDSTKFGYW